MYLKYTTLGILEVYYMYTFSIHLMYTFCISNLEQLEFTYSVNRIYLTEIDGT